MKSFAAIALATVVVVALAAAAGASGAASTTARAPVPSPAQALPSWSTVRLATEGPRVTTIQHLLRQHGHDAVVDGVFRVETETLTTEFQESANLEPTGVVDAETWRALVVEVTEGDSNDAVAALQTQLNRYGHGLQVDGVFGPATDAALRDFQSGHDALDETGVADVRSWQALTLAEGLGELPPGTSDRKVLMFDLDGVRRDRVLEADTPNLDALIEAGQFSEALLPDPVEYGVPTVSGPGHSHILTGTWPDKHQVTGNEIEPNDLATYPDFLTRLEAENPELSTFAVGDWKPLIEQIIASPDVKRWEPLENIDLAALFSAQSAQSITDWAVQAVTEFDFDAGYVYMIHTDKAGHLLGGAHPDYIAAIEYADARIGEILDAVRARPTYDQEDWLFLVSTDHGFRDDPEVHAGHGCPADALEECDVPEIREIWTVASGGAVPPGEGNAEVVDLAPTVLAHLSVDIDPAWNLDGAPIGSP